MAVADPLNGQGPDETEPLDSVAFHYLKSHAFRTVKADGVVGGVLPNGDVSVALWAERLPIPKTTHHALHPDGTLGDLTGREVRDGLIREVEVCLLLDAETAQAMGLWLLERSTEALEHRAELQRKDDTEGDSR